jgi:YHS domain-containing protein
MVGVAAAARAPESGDSFAVSDPRRTGCDAPGRRPTMATVTDPVCGMQFEESQAEAQTIYQDQVYFFCSEECRRTFEENPEEFVGSKPK